MVDEFAAWSEGGQISTAEYIIPCGDPGCWRKYMRQCPNAFCSVARWFVNVICPDVSVCGSERGASRKRGSVSGKIRLPQFPTTSRRSSCARDAHVSQDSISVSTADARADERRRNVTAVYSLVDMFRTQSMSHSKGTRHPLTSHPATCVNCWILGVSLTRCASENFCRAVVAYRCQAAR